MNYCGTCPYTDGAVYTSLPPKCKCTITNNFHYFGDACDCEEARAQKVADDIASAVEKKAWAPEDYIVINDFDSILDYKAPTFDYTVDTSQLSAAESAWGVKFEERPWADMITTSKPDMKHIYEVLSDCYLKQPSPGIEHLIAYVKQFI